MSEYFVLVLAVGFTAALGGAAIYDGERSAISNVAISVVLLSALVSPLASLLSGLPTLSIPELPDASPEDTGEYIEVAEEAFSRGIAELLAEKYSLPAESFAVKIEGFDFENMRADAIIVTLRDRAVVCDPLAVEKYINSYEIGECHAEVGI